MSLGRPKIPDPKVPAAEPPRPDAVPASQELGAQEQSTENLRRKKKGRNALRIDPQIGGAGVAPGQTGVNVPS